MPNNDSLVIIIFGLISIIIIVGVYGIVGYKIYLRNNRKQIMDIVDKYQSSQDEMIKTMARLVQWVEFFKDKNKIE